MAPDTIEQLKNIGVVIGLGVAVITVIFNTITIIINTIQLRSVKRQLLHQASLSVYGLAFNWDRLLIERPELYQLLENPSDSPCLTSQERALAEYRIDIIEFVYQQNNWNFYDADDSFLRRFLRTPLIKKAFNDDVIRNSVKKEFYEHCQTLLKNDEK